MDDLNGLKPPQIQNNTCLVGATKPNIRIMAGRLDRELAACLLDDGECAGKFLRVAWVDVAGGWGPAGL